MDRACCQSKFYRTGSRDDTSTVWDAVVLQKGLIRLAPCVQRHKLCLSNTAALPKYSQSPTPRSGGQAPALQSSGCFKRPSVSTLAKPQGNLPMRTCELGIQRYEHCCRAAKLSFSSRGSSGSLTILPWITPFLSIMNVPRVATPNASKKTPYC